MTQLDCGSMHLTSSHQGYYIFSGPPCRIIFSENSENISSHFVLSMKLSPDNQINTSFIDISRIKWLVFVLQLVPLQAPKQRPIIDPHLVEQTVYRRDIKDNGYKSVFTNSWLVRQRNRSRIKGLGKNSRKSELIH